MPDSLDYIVKVSSLIRKDFGFDTKELTDHSLLKALKEQLTQVIAYLLDKDFERLLQAMYRTDINEQKFKEALSNESPGKVAAAIAQLVIDRELQKLETRKKYSQNE